MRHKTRIDSRSQKRRPPMTEDGYYIAFAGLRHVAEITALLVDDEQTAPAVESTGSSAPRSQEE